MTTRYANFQKARATGGARNYFGEGTHVVSIMSVKFAETRPKNARPGMEFFAVQSRIIESTATDPGHAPGMTKDWATFSDKDPYEGNVKQFICAGYGETEDAVDLLLPHEFAELMELATGEAQGMVGKLMRVHCVAKISKDDNPYVASRWESISDDEAVEISERAGLVMA